MTYANYDDIVSQLKSSGLMLGTAKKSHGGIAVGELYVESSKSVRCDIDGERKKQSGAYRLHELHLDDGVWLTGAYWLDHGNYSYKLELRKYCAKCGADVPLKGSVCPSCGGKKTKSREIPKEQLEAHKKRMEESRRQADAEAKADAERAASWANAVWLKCREITSPEEHDYLVRKKLKSAHGARILDNHDGVILDGAEKSDYEYLAQFHGAMVVPMLDMIGRRRGLQFILSREKHKDLIRKKERDKESWPKGNISKGMHFLIGGQIQGVGMVTEGFATAASLHESYNLPVAVAFSANNLLPVGETIWKHSRRRARLLYCADDDWVQRCDIKTGGCGKYTPAADPACKHCGHTHGKKNVGVEYAQSAASATSGAWVAPAFSTQRPDDRKGDTDFNDLRCAEGEQAVCGQIAAKIEALGWNVPSLAQSSPRGDAAKQGGGEVGARRDAVSVMSLDEAVDRFVPLDDGTGKYLFDIWTSKIVSRDQMVALLPAGVRGDIVKSHPVWISRGAYYLDQVGFDPAGNDRMVKLNTWKGWPIRPKRGSCERLLELIDYLCSGEKNSDEVVKWLLCWMAYPLQNPGAKMNSAVIMHGPQGTGKSTVFQSLAKIYGDYSTVLNQRGLEDKFNADWSDSKLFILAEEVVTRAEMWHIKNELKELVTGEWIRVNPKNVAAYRQRNHVNIVYLSNEDQPLPLDNDDRRHCVIWTPPELGAEFYDEIFIEQENGGIEAFYHYLMHVDLSEFHPKKRPPMTESKEALITLSMPSEDRFVRDWIAGDIILHEDKPLPFCACGTDDLYLAYMRWCRKEGEQRPRAQNQFSSRMARRIGWEKGHRDRYSDYNFTGDKKRQRMITPSDHDMAEAMKRKAEDYRKKDDESLSQWATRCFFDFRKALGDER